jgi:hypothetical protein
MSDRISRGEIISLLAGIPLAVAATGSMASAADDAAAVASKKQFKYVLKAGPKGQICATCASFTAPAACTIVKGTISPKAYCIAYSPKAK